MLGAPGSAAGVPELAGEAAPSPTALFARILTEYDVPLASPEITRGEVDVAALIQAPAPLSWYSYEVGALPDNGGVNAKDRAPSCAVTDVMVGDVGTPIGVTELEGADAAPDPAVFTASTWNTYAVPSVRPVTVVDGVVETPSAKVVHVVGLEAWAYWTT